MQKGETIVAPAAQWMTVRCSTGGTSLCIILLFFSLVSAIFLIFFHIPFPDKILHSNEYLLAKIRFDTAENEPLEVRNIIEEASSKLPKNM